MIKIENWPVDLKVQSMSDKQISDAVFKAADDSRRENMGVPNQLLVEAAKRLAAQSEKQNMSKLVEVAAKAIAEEMGPPFGSPEYIAEHADRLIMRRDQAAKKYATLAVQTAIDTAVEEKLRASIDRYGKKLQYLNDHLPNISTPMMLGDNLAVTLCSYFDDGEDSEDDSGWSKAALDGYDQTIQAIRSHYAGLFDD